jgi:hypothetical protein
MEAVISLSENEVCAEFEVSYIKIKCIRIPYIHTAV